MDRSNNGKRKIHEGKTDSDNSLKKIAIQRNEEEKHLVSLRCNSIISEKVEKGELFLCFRIQDIGSQDSGSLFWYRIDSPNTIHEGSSINCISDTVCRIPPSVISMNCEIVALGSKIYMVGGDHEDRCQGSTDVIFIDTAAGGNGGDFVFHKEENSHLLLKRSYHVAVSTHEKMYVFGGHNVPIWCEVFDSKTNHWYPLPEPPLVVRQYPLASHLTSVVGDTILLFCRDYLFSFDVKTNHWENLTSTHPLLIEKACSKSVALDHNILLSYTPASVHAYDFSAKKWLKVKGLGMKSSCFRPGRDLHEGFVVSLGDNTFCVVWTDMIDMMDSNIQPYEDIYKRYVRCVRFRVARVNNSKGKIKFLQGEVLGRSVYQLPSGWKYLAGCFPM